MKLTVFYSWQSDKLGSINKNLIQQAAQEAIDRIAGSDEIEFEPSLDRDTQDVPGSPEIARCILEKIERCGIFISDVTIVTEESPRSCPNPNVLIEQGYAAGKIGWERIICVMNEAYGSAENLPFDLRHRRWPITYSLSPDAPQGKITRTRKQLSKTIEYAIKVILESGIIAHTINPKDRRVAVNFNKALAAFVGPLAGFLASRGYEPAMKIINEDHENEPGSNYPSVSLVEPILTVLSQTGFNTPSYLMVGEKRLSWSETFALVLQETAQECYRILDQYADRDEALISLIDEVSDRAKTMAQMMRLATTVPDFSDLYEKGVPEQHIEWFRYFLLAILKSYRIIRQFGVATE